MLYTPHTHTHTRKKGQLPYCSTPHSAGRNTTSITNHLLDEAIISTIIITHHTRYTTSGPGLDVQKMLAYGKRG